MNTISDLTLLGSGATANVYLYENDKILKLFNKEYDIESVEYESKSAQEISKSSIKAPKYYQIIQVNDQHGIIYEFVPGELLVSLLLRSSLSQGIVLIKELVRTQITINAITNNNISTQVDRLSYLINKVTIIDQYKKDIINGLRSIKQDYCVCHGDLHAGNAIVNTSGFMTIDWMNCYSGNKEGDLLRSYLLLITPYLPFSLGLTKKLLLKVYKRILGHYYRKEYLRISGLRKRDLNKWYPIIAAARLADNIPNEERWLLNLIKKKIKYLTTAST